MLASECEQILFPCKHTAPEGLFYIKHDQTWMLCSFKPKHYGLIPQQKSMDDYHGSEFEFLKAHSDVNYQHWQIDGVALIFDIQDVEQDLVGERDAAFVAVHPRHNDDAPIVASFEFALKISILQVEKSPSRKDLHVVAARELLSRQLWCVG